MLDCVQEYAPGKLMLYGGVGADGKPLNDAWLLNLEKPSWSLIYMGHSELCPPQVPPHILLTCALSGLPESAHAI